MLPDTQGDDRSRLVGPGTRILLTGATGYIGGRLAPRLLDLGYEVVCVARDPRKLRARPWSEHERCTVLEADVADREAMATAMSGCRVAYYLVHSMLVAGDDYCDRDNKLAASFAKAAAQAGVDRIIYLGGLGETGAGLSEHLTSRRAVEAVLASGGVPVTTLRAAMIIGSGSASFEILRYLVERLPIMVTPRWVDTRCQPIGIEDVLHYLTAVLTTPATTGRAIDVGGANVLSYREIMQVMARELRLRRRRVWALPLLTPRLSSLWIHLVTPVSGAIARPLAEGLRNEVVCRGDAARRLMPPVPMEVGEAIARAVEHEHSGQMPTTWCDAAPVVGDPGWSGGTVFVDERSVEVRTARAQVFAAVCRLGGDNGWYAADGLWRLRGWLDRLVGGPGLRRGRRHPTRVAHGEALDFWRVTGVEADSRLELRAEMRLPGSAFLAFDVEPTAAGCILRQTARFRARGLAGLLYWYAMKPLHGIVFSGTLRGIQREALGRRTA